MFRRLADYLSFGTWIIIGGAILSSIAFVCWPVPQSAGRDFWLFSPPNLPRYQEAAQAWNAEHPHPADQVNVLLIHYQAMERRLVAAFAANAPAADVVETEISMMSRAFSGSVSDVGFVDLTDRLRAEGLFGQINAPSFSLWSSRGRTFGLPKDVHPCLVGYRADLVEAAGIDVSTIETWDDFRRVLGPLVRDLDGDGRPDRFLLNFWENNRDLILVLLMQAGGTLFEEAGSVNLNTERNAYVLASLVSWVAGPGRFCVDAREFTAGGDRMRLDGTVIASILPDWLAGTWKNYIPGLNGKVKVMRLPAWEPGGLRTSVWGGTCAGIPKTAADVEWSWAFAKYLYLSPHIAETTYRSTSIVSPVKAFWKLPFYHEPDPFFSGQKIGELYLREAPHVPARVSSPYLQLVMDRLMSVLTTLKAGAMERNEFSTGSLLPEARRLLADAQEDISGRIERNVLYRQ